MNKSLSINSFQKYPVWKWNKSQESHEPVLHWQPLQRDESTLFIKANFVTSDGTELEGYLIGLDSFYAFGLFVKGNEYILNLDINRVRHD